MGHGSGFARFNNSALSSLVRSSLISSPFFSEEVIGMPQPGAPEFITTESGQPITTESGSDLVTE